MSVGAALRDLVYTASWRLPGRRWRRLYAFAEAEHESALELRRAAAATTDPARASLYLTHAADEARHARILVRQAARARGEALAPPRKGHADLFARLGEPRFVAFVHRGERRGRRQFEAHVRYFTRRDPALARALASILSDEQRHEEYTGELLAELTDAPGTALRRVAWADRAHRWRRAGAALTAPLFTAAMLLLYLLAAPLTLFLRRRSSGWRD